VTAGGRKILFMKGNAGSGTPMHGEVPQETWTALPHGLLPQPGFLLIAAGISLVLWSDMLVGLFTVFLGVLALILGIGFLAAGLLLGRAGIPPVLPVIAGLFSIIIGILAFLRRDLVLDLILSLAATLSILAGLFLLFLGGLLPVQGWGRRVFLGAGAAFLIAGMALFLFPGPVARVLLVTGGAVIVGTGCAALFLAISRRRDGLPQP
jgi:hypothetical protein